MRLAKDVRREILELKREMKADGIPIRSCFNGGHTRESMRYNARLFALKAELERSAHTSIGGINER